MTRDEYQQRAVELAPRGNKLPHAKLSAEVVREIREKRERALKEAERWTAKAIAERYQVHYRTIEKVLSYATWRHV